MPSWTSSRLSSARRRFFPATLLWGDRGASRGNDLHETFSRLTSLNRNLTYFSQELVKSHNARKEIYPRRKRRMLVSLVMAGILLGAVAAAKAEEGPIYPIGEVTIEATQLAAGVGYSWGNGVMKSRARSTISRSRASMWRRWGSRKSTPWATSII